MMMMMMIIIKANDKTIPVSKPTPCALTEHHMKKVYWVVEV
jgi:hypothetical protein